MTCQVNCLLETFFDAAIDDAKKVDQYFAQHKKPIGPLHGLPISLKDQFHVKGVDTSMGYVGQLSPIAPQNHAQTDMKQGGLAPLKARRIRDESEYLRARWSRSCGTLVQSSSAKQACRIP